MDNKFTIKNLIKGKIAEIIFEQMFLKAGDYTIIPFGYEKTVPELARYKQFSSEQRKIVDNIRNAPDYAMISPDRTSVFLVEVKFRSKIYIKEIIEIVEKQKERWNPSWLFVATLEGFYLGECSDIIRYKRISKIETSMVSKDLQDKCLRLIQEFER
ncbi:MAG: hypothetical protein AAB465_02495 [Patescibacteria group bacterium]